MIRFSRRQCNVLYYITLWGYGISMIVFIYGLTQMPKEFNKGIMPGFMDVIKDNEEMKKEMKQAIKDNQDDIKLVAISVMPSCTVPWHENKYKIHDPKP